MKAKILTILNLCLCLLMIQQVHSQTDEVGYYKAPLSNDTSRYRARNSDFCIMYLREEISVYK